VALGAVLKGENLIQTLNISIILGFSFCNGCHGSRRDQHLGNYPAHTGINRFRGPIVDSARHDGARNYYLEKGVRILVVDKRLSS
jgi:hypothetical protein